jgi:hypothetical protein
MAATLLHQTNRCGSRLKTGSCWRETERLAQKAFDRELGATVLEFRRRKNHFFSAES